MVKPVDFTRWAIVTSSALFGAAHFEPLQFPALFLFGLVAATLDPGAPEVRAQALFRDRFVGVVRMGHSLSEGKITPSRDANGR